MGNKCECCGQRFEPRQSSQRFCSARCRRRARKRRQRGLPAQDQSVPARTCACCGGQFHPLQTTQRYCGQRCRERAKKRRHRHPGSTGALEARICLGCGTTFKPRRANNWYCCDRCRQIVAIMRYRQRTTQRHALITQLDALHRDRGDGHCAYCAQPFPCYESQLLKGHQP